ncbi:MAG: DUF4167 domain-containing protein [Pelagibacteraceae bacterium]|jgi:hypothetical protein|nr:hypothetical protein [Candidatus Pelagibacter sp.]MDP6680872.1 DUF4167 domain-containing protein [Pelagibacteraceae bacterium]MDP6710107.1 DUF4167 domain-containing protein [Pelagibacteraceae bacterium]
MFQHRPRRFRRRSSSGRNRQSRDNGFRRTGMESISLTNFQGRNNINQYQSATKLAEKYEILAKEALSKGDKTLSESYFQHADHYMRIVNEKNLNQSQNRVKDFENQEAAGKNIDNNISIDQGKTSRIDKEEKE